MESNISNKPPSFLDMIVKKKTKSRNYDYSIYAEGYGKIVSFAVPSEEEARRKGKNFCETFGYPFSHVEKGKASYVSKRFKGSQSE